MAFNSSPMEDTTITHKRADGSSVTVKSPKGSSNEMLGLLGGRVKGNSPTPVSDDVPAMLTSGEYVVSRPAAMKYGGLLDKINNEGRQMLRAQGYQMGGPVMRYANGGYADYSPEMFLSEAQRINTPGASFSGQPYSAPAPVIPAKETFTEEKVASPIVNKGKPPSDQDIAQSSGESEAIAAHQAGLPKNEAITLGRLLKNSKNKTDLVTGLEDLIAKKEGKRDKARYLGFGLALLNGEGIAGSLGVANAVGNMAAGNLDELYERRKQIMDATLAGDYGVASDLYRKAATGGPSASGEYPKLSATLQKVVRDLNKKSTDNRTSVNRINGLINDIEANPGAEGIAGRIAEGAKSIFGAQGDVSLWKTNYNQLINSEVVQNLPPGVASDKDIQLVKSGFPDNNWDEVALVSWLQGYRKLISYVADRDRHRAAYIERTGRQTGWEESFEGNVPSTTSTTADTGSTEFDYDFSGG